MFLTYRVEEDFVLPLNPVWMVQDGTNVWSELFEKMLANEHRGIAATRTATAFA